MTQPEIDRDEWVRDQPKLSEFDYAKSEDPETYDDIHD